MSETTAFALILMIATGIQGNPAIDIKTIQEAAVIEARTIKQSSATPGTTRPIGAYVVIHSQSTIIPECPLGSVKLWAGYSFPFGDLGTAGSCLRKFSAAPFLFCDNNELCHLASRSDKSFWLSTNGFSPSVPVQSNDVSSFISRCAVCEVPVNVLTVHGQSKQIPFCPEGWMDLWNGYSFVMHTSTGSPALGQSLDSPGSCLHNFMASPIIECSSESGKCYKYQDQLSFWLSTVDGDSQFGQPRAETLRRSISDETSRCIVCMKNI